MQCQDPQWRWGNNSCQYFPFGLGWELTTHILYVYRSVCCEWLYSNVVSMLLFLQFSCHKVILTVTVFVLLQNLPRRPSAGFREKQSIGKMSPSPACLSKDPQNLPISGRATLWKADSVYFHQRQLKVCISTTCFFDAHIFGGVGFPFASVYIKNNKMFCFIMLQRMELYHYSIFQERHLGSTFARQQIGLVLPVATSP